MQRVRMVLIEMEVTSGIRAKFFGMVVGAGEGDG